MTSTYTHETGKPFVLTEGSEMFARDGRFFMTAADGQTFEFVSELAYNAGVAMAYKYGGDALSIEDHFIM